MNRDDAIDAGHLEHPAGTVAARDEHDVPACRPAALRLPDEDPAGGRIDEARAAEVDDDRAEPERRGGLQRVAQVAVCVEVELTGDRDEGDALGDLGDGRPERRDRDYVATVGKGR
jgi:hypothetical protein